MECRRTRAKRLVGTEPDFICGWKAPTSICSLSTARQGNVVVRPKAVLVALLPWKRHSSTEAQMLRENERVRLPCSSVRRLRPVQRLLLFATRSRHPLQRLQNTSCSCTSQALRPVSYVSIVK
jgi:hypothetical protein